tara:strand:- start:2 stop:1051 length:1050 start_codon:yes stop_codon:yes gene_type:complete
MSAAGAATFNASGTFNEVGGDHDFRVESDANASMLFVDASTNRVGINTSAPDRILHVNENVNGGTEIHVDNANTGDAAYAGLYLQGQGNNFFLKNWGDAVAGKSNSTEFVSTAGGSSFVFNAATFIFNETGADADFRVESDTNTHALFVDGGGDRVGIGLVPTYKLDVLNTTGNVVSARFTTTATAAQSYGPMVILTNDPNDTTRYLFAGGSASTHRCVIYSNGNIQNQNNSYTAISDEKLKENIVDAGSQWDDIKALRVRKYSLKEENASEPTQIGVIAQEVEAAGMSGLVYETPDQVTAEDGTIEDTGEVTKNMKYSILYMKAIKALQEAMTRIETLETRLTALENA